MSERYQFEVHEKVSAGASIPDEWQIASSTKTAKRYVTDETQQFARDIAKLELIKEEGEKDAARLVFFNFARHHAVWDRVVSIIGELDCLASLALVSKNHRQCVRPEFVSFESNDNKAMLNLRGSVHPTLYEADNVNGLKPGAHQSFIANDVLMGADENPARFVLVSGPNMGVCKTSDTSTERSRDRGRAILPVRFCSLRSFSCVQEENRLCFVRLAAP